MKATIDIQHRLIYALALLLVVLYFTPRAAAANNYAQESVLSNGRWVKIATTQQGIHRIDAATLSEWGFDNASEVALYGRDGYMLPETLDGNCTYDLQPLPTYTEDGNLYFYATGGVKWEQDDLYWTHSNNYYTQTSYYFLTNSYEPLSIESKESAPNEGDAIIAFDEHFLHEQDLTNVGQSGCLYIGEALSFDKALTIDLPDVASNSMTIDIRLAAKSSTTRTLTVKCNHTTLSPLLTVRVCDSYTYLQLPERRYDISGEEQLNFTFSSTGTLDPFALDYIRVFYKRALRLNEPSLQFRCKNLNGYFSIDAQNRNPENIRVWNITDVNAPFMQKTLHEGNNITFTPQDVTTPCQEYVAFDFSDNTLASPRYIGEVTNQNLHGIASEPDMVIITTQYFLHEANRLAQLHRDIDNMNVIVCDQVQIFNEFSGGTPDATALRRFMKMLYDKGHSNGKTPRYLLMYGRSHYNNRAISDSFVDPNNKLLISYQSKPTIDIRHTYCSDDYFVILNNMSNDISKEKLDIAVGRLSVRDLNESQSIYNKIYIYLHQKPINNLWKNKSCFIGMNGDNLLHITQVDRVATQTIEQNQKQMIVDKVYMSAYPTKDKKNYEGAKEQIFRDLEEGALLFNYMGHSDPVGIGRVIDISEANALNNHFWPIFITATCDVAPYFKEQKTIGETFVFNENGGFIALFTSTGTVYTTGNENINTALMNDFFVRDEENKIRLGDIMRRAKNSLTTGPSGSVSDPNKLKYCLLGDPALALPIPTLSIVVDSIDGTKVSALTHINAQANHEIIIGGNILDRNDKVATDFNGTLCYELYDAPVNATATETSKVGAHEISIEKAFEVRPYKLATGATTVKDGHFSTTIRIPQVCLQSDTTLLLTLYAHNEAGTEAWGYIESLIIEGVNKANNDTQGLKLTHIWIGNEHFDEGDVVENETLLHCEIVECGSQLSTNELMLGKEMTLWLDGNILCNDLSGYYSSKNTSDGGYIDYPLHNLTEGVHQATVRVYDNQGNRSEITTTFVVEPSQQAVYQIEIAEDPITTQATITLDGEIENGSEIRFVIADATTGQEVWTTLTHTPQVVWDVTAMENPVAPGAYICYAIVRDGTKNFVSSSKNLVILRQ